MNNKQTNIHTYIYKRFTVLKCATTGKVIPEALLNNIDISLTEMC